MYTLGLLVPLPTSKHYTAIFLTFWPFFARLPHFRHGKASFSPKQRARIESKFAGIVEQAETLELGLREVRSHPRSLPISDQS